MVKLNLTNKNLLSQDQELINSLTENGFSLNYEGFYTRKIGNRAIQVTPDLKVSLSEISNPGRDETWNRYNNLKFETTEELAKELSKIINSLT